MLGSAWWTLRWTLRQRRYRALAAAGLVVALICVGAGTFEVHRFHEKVHDNRVLAANGHAPATAFSGTLVPLVGTAPPPSAHAIRYRTVTVSGRYLSDRQQYVASKTQGGRQGFWVLTPLQTRSGVLLVARGFVAATASEARPSVVPAPPSDPVRITGRLQTPDTRTDQLGRLGDDEIMSINPAQQATRLGLPTYDAYLTLDAHQPGTAGLTALPGPDLGNPTGGAAEWQLLSYVVQWYVFAVLALLVPFLVGRSEVRDARRRFLGIDPEAGELDDDAEALPARAALEAGAGGAVAVRDSGALARRADEAERQWARATRLADRYGRSLGDLSPAEVAAAAQRRSSSPEVPTSTVRRSGDEPHRSADDYHGSYNDYLWKLALADGGLPDVFGPDAGDQSGEPGPPAQRVVRPDGTFDDDAPGDRPGPVP